MKMKGMRRDNVPSVQIIENLAVTQKMDRNIIINKERFRLFIVYMGIRKPVVSRFEWTVNKIQDW